MKFYGQNKIIKELGFLLKEVDNGSNYNILFRAPSGYGKSMLGLSILNHVGLSNSRYYIPDKDGEINYIDYDKRFHFMDEIHTFSTPELLYPMMDSNNFTIILATNESGILKEPLTNRCIQFIFEEYAEGEMIELVEDILQEYNLRKELIEAIARGVKGNPRVAKKVCERLNYVFRNYLVPKSIEDLTKILEEILSISEGGLNQLDKHYLEILEKLGGRASLDTLINSTRFDKGTILREIEPFLIYKGMVRISSRGRELNG